MASSDGDSQLKIVHGEAGYILEDVPHFSDYIPNLPVFLSLFHFQWHLRTASSHIHYSQFLFGFVCRRIQIRCDPIQLTRLLSKWIASFDIVIVIRVLWNVLTVFGIFGYVFCVIRQYFVHMDDTVPQKVRSISLHATCLFNSPVHLSQTLLRCSFLLHRSINYFAKFTILLLCFKIFVA